MPVCVLEFEPEPEPTAFMPCSANATPPNTYSTDHTIAKVAEGGADGVSALASRMLLDLVAAGMPKPPPMATAAAAMHTPAMAPGFPCSAGTGWKNAAFIPLNII